jgi:hypothetical protein
MKKRSWDWEEIRRNLLLDKEKRRNEKKLNLRKRKKKE